MEQINPCVVCGKEAKIEQGEWRGLSYFYVQCANCCMTGEVCETREDAVELWDELTLEKWMEE
jgi:hypothetical protein